MSRNYQEYQQIYNSTKKIDKPVKIPDLPEDLRTLQGFTL